MKLIENKDYISRKLRDTILAFCKDVVSFNVVLKVEGFIVLTCDEENVLVVKIDDNHRGNCGQSKVPNSSFGSEPPCKLYTLSNSNRIINPKQPLALQYSNWNANVNDPHVVKQPRARQKASQQKKNVFQPRIMGIGQRMGMMGPRMSAPKITQSARKTGNIRQRFSNSVPRNIMQPRNPTQTMAMNPMTNFRQRMPSLMPPRQPVPTPNRQLAIQYIPSNMDTSNVIGQNFAICDVASNEVVEATSPFQFLDESREKMFKDVVSDALSKLDKSSELSSLISDNVPKSLNTSVGVIALPQTSQAIPPSYDSVLKSNICNVGLDVQRIGKQSQDDTRRQFVQNQLCLPYDVVNANQQSTPNLYCAQKVDPVSQNIVSRECLKNQVANSFDQRNSSIGNPSNYLIQAKPASQLQISLVTISKSTNSNPINIQPGVIQKQNLLSSLTMPQKLVTSSNSVGHVMRKHSESMIWPSQIVREAMYRPPQTEHGMSHLYPQMNSGTVQWPGITSQNVPRMHQASSLSEELKKQLHNLFDRQIQPQQVVKPVPGGNNLFSHPQQFIQTSYASSPKNNPYSTVSCTTPLASNLYGAVTCSIPKSISSQNPTRHSVAFSIATNSHFTYGNCQPNLVYNQSHPNQMINQQMNWMPNAHQGIQERNLFNQFCNEQNFYQLGKFSSNSLVDDMANAAILPNSFNQVTSNLLSTDTNHPSGQTFMLNNFQMDLKKFPSMQQVVQLGVSRDNNIISQCIKVTSSPLLFYSGSVPLDYTCISSSLSLKPKSCSDLSLSHVRKSTISSQSVTSSNSLSLVVPVTLEPANLHLATPICLSNPMKNTNFDLDEINKTSEKRLPPLRLKNLGHGNLMVIDSNKKEVSCEVPQKRDDLDAIVMMAVEGLKEDSFKKQLYENVSCEQSKNEQDIYSLNATLDYECDIINQDLSFADYGYNIDNSLKANSDNENTSQIIRDVRLSSIDDIFNQNSFNDDNLTSGNLNLDHEEITVENFGVFDVCRNEEVITHNGNGNESPSNEQLSDLSEKTLENPVNILDVSPFKHKKPVSESDDAREKAMDLKTKVGSDANYLQQYTCQACQISMDSNIMLAEHYSTFHTNPELHWIENEVRPYLDRTYNGNLTCPFEGCLKTFATSRQVITHYNKAHKMKMTYKQITSIKNKEGSLVCCEYCKSKFPSKRLLNEHVSNEH